MLRLLYDGSQSFSYLERHCDMKRIDLLRTLEKLRAFYDIKAKKIEVDEDTDMDIAESPIIAGIFGVDIEPKKKYITRYSITRQGISKVCFYEYTRSMHQLWQPPNFEKIWQDKYEHKIAEEIKNQAFYKKEHNLA